MKAIFFILAVAGVAAGQSVLHRDGNTWVDSTKGSEAVGEAEQLRISCLGNITVRGGAGSQVEYSVNRRFRARDEAQARTALEEAGVSLTRQGRFMRLVVNDATGPVELQVTVPRGLSGLILATDSGTIEATDLSGSVRAQTGAGDIRLSRVKGSVDIGTAGGSLRLGEIGGWVKATTAAGDITAESIGGESRLESAGGNITVDKAGGAFRAHTAGGNVRLHQASGAVIAVTDGGSIDLGHVGGSVVARNAGGGPILVGSAGGGVRCESASGAIKVGSVTGGPIRLATASGSVVVQVLDKLLAESSISTGSGDITVYLPSNLGVMIRAENQGSVRPQGIVSEFPGLQVRMDGGTVSARGTLNGGGPELRIEGTSGTIWIKRKQ